MRKRYASAKLVLNRGHVQVVVRVHRAGVLQPEMDLVLRVFPTWAVKFGRQSTFVISSFATAPGKANVNCTSASTLSPPLSADRRCSTRSEACRRANAWRGN